MTCPRVPPPLAGAMFAFPALCFVVACDCETLCPVLGALGCIALAALLATGLFAALGVIDELRALAHLAPTHPRFPPGEHP